MRDEKERERDRDRDRETDRQFKLRSGWLCGVMSLSLALRLPFQGEVLFVCTRTQLKKDVDSPPACVIAT
ncbi:conserved hypothetical protein [Ricinus communis]|uniref:Uncharacterized protein n=1 Tax=Ricinus communis TaxID=3988 RepID=B9RJ99_RICCO|nr:conserved hypothetical protein [Ricinus communis]